MSERTGDVLDGRYRLERRIGTGGTSDVWAATDRRLDRPVAVKCVRIDPDDAVAARRGPAEARLLGGLAHPHLVSVYDAHFPADGGSAPAYLVMELVEGGTLASALSAGPVTVARVRDIVGTVASALAYLRGRGVVHRDVKPANILFTRDGQTKLTDFGIARVVGSPGLTQTGLLMGTAPYLSPEQVRGLPPTPASDVYSLGLVLLEALTGVRAYPGTASESAIARLTRRPDIPDWVAPELATLVQAMTADDPAARPTAAEVAARLGAAAAADRAVAGAAAFIGAPAPTPTAVLPPADVPTVAVPQSRRRSALRWLALPIAAAVAAVIALLSTSGQGAPGPVTPAPTTASRAPASPSSTTVPAPATAPAVSAPVGPAGGPKVKPTPPDKGGHKGHDEGDG